MLGFNPDSDLGTSVVDPDPNWIRTYSATLWIRIHAALYTTYLFITEVEYINTRDAYSQPLECRKCIKIKIQSYQS